MTEEANDRFDLTRAAAQDLGTLLSMAQAGVLLELPSVRQELKRLKRRLVRRLDQGGREGLPGDLAVVYQGAAGHIGRLLDRKERGEDLSAPATPETLRKRRFDWLAAERRAGRLDPDAERALDHLGELWREIRESLQESTLPIERVFRDRVRKEVLLPLERLKEADYRAAMDCWLPWARHWHRKPACKGNHIKGASVLDVVELLILQGRDPKALEAQFGIPSGGAKLLLEEALKDYARKLDFYLDKNANSQ